MALRLEEPDPRPPRREVTVAVGTVGEVSSPELAEAITRVPWIPPIGEVEGIRAGGDGNSRFCRRAGSDVDGVV